MSESEIKITAKFHPCQQTNNNYTHKSTKDGNFFTFSAAWITIAILRSWVPYQFEFHHSHSSLNTHKKWLLLSIYSYRFDNNHPEKKKLSPENQKKNSHTSQFLTNFISWQLAIFHSTSTKPGFIRRQKTLIVRITLFSSWFFIWFSEFSSFKIHSIRILIFMFNNFLPYNTERNLQLIETQRKVDRNNQNKFEFIST